MDNTKKVLIAEDSSVIQNLTKKVLQFQNYEIDSAKNGEEVIKAVNQKKYDIILMDIGMPKIDGMECTKQIRAMDDAGKAKVPIVAITGNAQNYSEEEFKSVGIDVYISKPIDFDNLVDVVKKHTS